MGWSHYFEILRSDNELEISFYIKQAEKENWSVRELKRQMKSILFHRLALSKDKNGILELSEQTMMENLKLAPAVRERNKDISNTFKVGYVFEFLNLPDPHSETDLQRGLVSQMKILALEFSCARTKTVKL